MAEPPERVEGGIPYKKSSYRFGRWVASGSPQNAAVSARNVRVRVGNEVAHSEQATTQIFGLSPPAPSWFGISGVLRIGRAKSIPGFTCFELWEAEIGGPLQSTGCEKLEGGTWMKPGERAALFGDIATARMLEISLRKSL